MLSLYQAINYFVSYAELLMAADTLSDDTEYVLDTDRRTLERTNRFYINI